MQSHSSEVTCRRRAVRISLPLELQLSTDSGAVKAILRDVCLDDPAADGSMGIGLFHKDALQLQQTMHCLRLPDTRLLFAEFDVTLFWTRSFGEDGYISGGRLTRIVESVAQRDRVESVV